ncbi:hypothetical protein P280DRAFT_83991 [Massarina eburnea CBS 473.64]|uniref:Uncharacterized protein n=1 Tax=Massarina eburnea CBS 473.64 TaxID=1395130 RepID=A0A6A6RT94_9PLEO|nr:hypothetical protein P280DRAFT_83991 [Massarina eburnea CBS 473.64]
MYSSTNQPLNQTSPHHITSEKSQEQAERRSSQHIPYEIPYHACINQPIFYMYAHYPHPQSSLHIIILCHGGGRKSFMPYSPTSPPPPSNREGERKRHRNARYYPPISNKHHRPSKTPEHTSLMIK